MPALAPYIPVRDVDLDTWSANFSTLITAAPATYGLVAGDASAIAAAVLAWHTAYLLMTSPTTKTKAAVQDKNTQRTLMLATVRPYAQNIALNAGVDPTDKVAIGVNPRTSVPVPITAPTTYPAITIVQALSLSHVIAYRDQLSSPTVKSKPYGVLGVQIYATASATVITDPTTLTYRQTTPKSPLLQSWDSGDVGKQAYYTARYVTRKGLFGPWSPIVHFTVAA